MTIKEKGLYEDMATVKQWMLDIDRRIGSYHSDIKLYKDDTKEYIGDQLKIFKGDIFEHINKVGAAQRIDMQANRDYCETENKHLYKAINSLKARMDKVAYGTGGALFIIGLIAWAIETLAK